MSLRITELLPESSAHSPTGDGTDSVRKSLSSMTPRLAAHVQRTESQLTAEWHARRQVPRRALEYRKRLFIFAGCAQISQPTGDNSKAATQVKEDPALLAIDSF